MTLHFNDADTLITSDEVAATARRDGGHWTVTGHRGALDRNGAISALTIAEELARPEPNTLLIESLRSELR